MRKETMEACERAYRRSRRAEKQIPPASNPVKIKFVDLDTCQRCRKKNACDCQPDQPGALPGSIVYKDLGIFPEPHYGGKFMIAKDWDTYQVPPFETIQEAKNYIDAGGNGTMRDRPEIMKRFFHWIKS